MSLKFRKTIKILKLSQNYLVLIKIKCLSDNHAQRSNVIWLSTTWLLIFRFWRLQIKSFYSQSLLVHELKFPGKKIWFFTVTKFCTLPSGCYTGKMLVAKASKTIRNWLSTLQPDIFKVICNLPKWAQERARMQYEPLTVKCTHLTA